MPFADLGMVNFGFTPTRNTKANFRRTVIRRSFLSGNLRPWPQLHKNDRFGSVADFRIAGINARYPILIRRLSPSLVIASRGSEYA